MNNQWSRRLSVVIGLLIIGYGIFGQLLLPYLQSVLDSILGSIPFASGLPLFFNGLETSSKDHYNMARYLIFYPIYLGLHVLMVFALFRNYPKARRYGLLLILVLIPFLGLFAMVFFMLGFETLYRVFASTVSNFLKLPVILFLVEGGRIFNQDIDRMLSEKDRS